MTSADCNGWADVPEPERETLDQWEATLPRTLDDIARDLEASGKAYTRAATHYCSDAAFARISDRHFDLLAEYNAVAEALGQPLFHQLQYVQQ